jgi:DNA modification methylase
VSLAYEDEYIQLFHGDMTVELDWIDADVLITDPPYGMKYQSNSSKLGKSAPIYGDGDTDLRDRCLELWGNDKPAIVFGTWRVPRPAATRQLVIWHKGDSPGMGDLTLPWGPSHEDIYVLGGRGAEPWVGPRGPSVIRSRLREGTAQPDHDHPTPKPVMLMQTLISHTNPEYVIADPFAGSGSTLVAAKLLKRKAIGVELDSQYIEATIRRLERVK